MEGGQRGWESWIDTKLGKAKSPEVKKRLLRSLSCWTLWGGCWLFFMRLLETPWLWETLKYLHFWQDGKIVSYPELVRLQFQTARAERGGDGHFHPCLAIFIPFGSYTLTGEQSWAGRTGHPKGRGTGQAIFYLEVTVSTPDPG